MMNVPLSVIIGKSPMKTVCSLISPVLAVGEPGPHEDRGRVRHVLLFALLHRELGRRAQVLVIRIELELELEVLGEVLDRADVAEGLREALVQEPLERGALDRNQIRQVEGLGEVGERITLTDSTTSGQLRLPERSMRRVPRHAGTPRRNGEAKRDARQPVIVPVKAHRINPKALRLSGNP